MDILCIKIGENEPETYNGYNSLIKHLDIISLQQRKRDKNGNLIERTMGRIGDRVFQGISVNLSHLNDTEHGILRLFLKTPLEPDVIDQFYDEELDEWHNVRRPVTSQRLYALDLSRVNFLTQAQKDTIELQATKKRSIKPMVYQWIADQEMLTGETPLRETVTLYEQSLTEIVGFDMRSLNDWQNQIDYSTFLDTIVNKKTGNTLKQDLEI